MESLEAFLREQALAYPGAYEEQPWGERVVKVKGKIFFFCGIYQGDLTVTTKLPSSGTAALQMPFTSPTHYGMGKHGWVTSRFTRAEDVPVDTVLGWLRESYCSIAPKTMVKALLAGTPAPVAKAPPRKKSRGAIVLVGDDASRLERARTELASGGWTIMAEGSPAPDTLDHFSKRLPRAVVIDLGRRAPDGIELGRAIAELYRQVAIVFAGVRDAEHDRRARAAVPSAAGCSRMPPGDPQFATFLADALRSD